MDFRIEQSEEFLDSAYSRSRRPIGAGIQSKPVSIRVHRPTPQARDAPDGESCVENNRRPHQNADESHACASVGENRGSSAVIEQHRCDQPAPGAARSIIARQPAGAAQREQRGAGDTAHHQCGRRIERYPEQ